VVHFTPLLLKAFNLRKRAVTLKWHLDETYIKVDFNGLNLTQVAQAGSAAPAPTKAFSDRGWLGKRP